MEVINDGSNTQGTSPIPHFHELQRFADYSEEAIRDITVCQKLANLQRAYVINHRDVRNYMDTLCSEYYKAIGSMNSEKQ